MLGVCGEDLAQRAADRIVLQGPPAEGVVDAWKAVFENVQLTLTTTTGYVQTPCLLVEKSQGKCAESAFP